MDAVDTNLFQLGSTDPKKYSQTLYVFFDGGLSPPPKKKYFFVQNFQNKIQKFSNMHEWSRIGWIERKIKFPVFIIFIFRVLVIFLLKMIFLLIFTFYSAHSASFIKIWPLLRTECPHILPWDGTVQGQKNCVSFYFLFNIFSDIFIHLKFLWLFFLWRAGSVACMHNGDTT